MCLGSSSTIISSIIIIKEYFLSAMQLKKLLEHFTEITIIQMQYAIYYNIKSSQIKTFLFPCGQKLSKASLVLHTCELKEGNRETRTKQLSSMEIESSGQSGGWESRVFMAGMICRIP